MMSFTMIPKSEIRSPSIPMIIIMISYAVIRISSFRRSRTAYRYGNSCKLYHIRHNVSIKTFPKMLWLNIKMFVNQSNYTHRAVDCSFSTCYNQKYNKKEPAPKCSLFIIIFFSCFENANSRITSGI